jgi:hypothetical protein
MPNLSESRGFPLPNPSKWNPTEWNHKPNTDPIGLPNIPRFFGVTNPNKYMSLDSKSMAHFLPMEYQSHISIDDGRMNNTVARTSPATNLYVEPYVNATEPVTNPIPSSVPRPGKEPHKMGQTLNPLSQCVHETMPVYMQAVPTIGSTPEQRTPPVHPISMHPNVHTHTGVPSNHTMGDTILRVPSDTNLSGQPTLQYNHVSSLLRPHRDGSNTPRSETCNTDSCLATTNTVAHGGIRTDDAPYNTKAVNVIRSIDVSVGNTPQHPIRKLQRTDPQASRPDGTHQNVGVSSENDDHLNHELRMNDQKVSQMVEPTHQSVMNVPITGLQRRDIPTVTGSSNASMTTQNTISVPGMETNWKTTESTRGTQRTTTEETPSVNYSLVAPTTNEKLTPRSTSNMDVVVKRNGAVDKHRLSWDRSAPFKNGADGLQDWRSGTRKVFPG